MRGTPVSRLRFYRIRGIIPAYAGNTRPTCRAGATRWDHPRICGEHLLDISDHRTIKGSSPHMRGTLRGGLFVRNAYGIIPAYAGNTRPKPSPVVPVRDHPRICGEHICSGSYATTVPGSSPHMRGTQVILKSSLLPKGIIPAYAGNTCLSSLRRFATGDHPRICGEHLPPVMMDAKRRGSSPHMRGTLRGYLDSRPQFRDHPRICGEHSTVPTT